MHFYERWKKFFLEDETERLGILYEGDEIENI